MRIHNLLDNMLSQQASDLHIKVGERPLIRVDGQLQYLDEQARVPMEEIEAYIDHMLNDEQRARFLVDKQLDFAYSTPNGRRYRCNCFLDLKGPAAAFRRIPEIVPKPSHLGLPEAVEALAHRRSGLVIVSGATGSGKSSTIAALVRAINTHYAKHIITLEDPVEFRHENQRSLIHQRGLYTEFSSFDSGLRAALREDPDVIVVGELRNIESIRLALLAAELGTMVYTTLHTNGAAESISRILDVFDADEQTQVRAVLAETLTAIVSQVLLRRRDGQGRALATEILINTHAVRNLIRQNRVQDVNSVIQSSGSVGMRTLEESLQRLVSQGIVSSEEALPYSGDKERLLRKVPMRATAVTE